VESYNAAVGERPAAGVRPLAADPARGRWELPLWRIAAGEPRAAVYIERGQALDPARHGPRALLMTGLLRAAGCDLFIHGTGGGIYDQISERWLGRWLGMTLAPSAVVSATLRLDLGLGGMTPGRAQAAVALAHRARHDPALLGDPDAAARKRELVQRIDALERGDPARAPLFARMHRALEEARAGAGERLAALDRSADAAAALLRSRDALEDRTWSCVLPQPAAIARLCERVAARF
jgi:hypothetical protein